MRISPWRHATRCVRYGCYHCNRYGRNAADQCKLVRGDTPPGAFAMAVTIVTEAVGMPLTNAN